MMEATTQWFVGIVRAIFRIPSPSKQFLKGTEDFPQRFKEVVDAQWREIDDERLWRLKHK